MPTEIDFISLWQYLFPLNFSHLMLSVVFPVSQILTFVSGPLLKGICGKFPYVWLMRFHRRNYESFHPTFLNKLKWQKKDM